MRRLIASLCAFGVVAASSLGASAAPPAHYYSWHRGGFYGYEMVQSEFSREHGAAPPALTYWYEGQSGGVYHLRQFNGPYIDMIRCTAPCTTVRIINAQVDQGLAVRPDTALWAALQDMLAGQLEVHR